MFGFVFKAFLKRVGALQLQRVDNDVEPRVERRTSDPCPREVEAEGLHDKTVLYKEEGETWKRV